MYQSGARHVHIRPACPPIVYGCKYLNFSRSTSEMDLIARKMMKQIEGKNPDEAVVQEYTNPETERYAQMNEEIRKKLNFTSLRYHRLDDLIQSVGIPTCNLCTYCWNGKEE